MPVSNYATVKMVTAGVSQLICTIFSGVHKQFILIIPFQFHFLLLRRGRILTLSDYPSNVKTFEL